jgi:hypothetical protein
MNTHNTSSSAPHSLNSNRRELPNVPKNTTNFDTKPPLTTSQNPFYNSTTTNNTNSINASRSTPSQWMGNIGQTLRRQTSNVDVKQKPKKIIFLFLLFFVFK